MYPGANQTAFNTLCFSAISVIGGREYLILHTTAICAAERQAPIFKQTVLR
jgi:hypothetical protein